MHMKIFFTKLINPYNYMYDNTRELNPLLVQTWLHYTPGRATPENYIIYSATVMLNLELLWHVKSLFFLSHSWYCDLLKS